MLRDRLCSNEASLSISPWVYHCLPNHQKDSLVRMSLCQVKDERQGSGVAQSRSQEAIWFKLCLSSVQYSKFRTRVSLSWDQLHLPPTLPYVIICISKGVEPSPSLSLLRGDCFYLYASYISPGATVYIDTIIITITTFNMPSIYFHNCMPYFTDVPGGIKTH